MAKPSSPLRADWKAPQPREHRYIGALVADDFGGMRALTLATANGFARKKLDAAAQSLQLRTERQEKNARRTEAREHAAAERGVQAELRESDRHIRLFWRRMLTKVRPEKKVRHTPPRARKRLWPHTSVALPKYDAPVIDRRGERGVFAKFRYYSRRTAKAGVSQRVLLYCYNGAALDASGMPYAHSNIGETIDEALCGLDHLEQINWSAQKNAKLLMHGILSVDHRQTADQMMRVGTRWAEETLGRFDLPYLVTLHAPPEDGDARNWHCHVLWSFRPMVRTGDHEWQVAEMLRTDLDNPAAMKVFREMYAAVMTDVSFEAGQNEVWTAKSNADRGLVHEPQVSLGAARTNRARKGEHVPVNEENHERVMRSKAAALDEELRHADEALARLQAIDRAVAGRWARPVPLAIRVPQRAIAAALSARPPSITGPVARVTHMAPPAITLPVGPIAAQPVAPVPRLTQAALPRVTERERPAVTEHLALPAAPTRTEPPEIVNTRFPVALGSAHPLITLARLPGGRVALPAILEVPALTSVAAARVEAISPMPVPPTRMAVALATIPALGSRPPARSAGFLAPAALQARLAVTPVPGRMRPVSLPLESVEGTSVELAIGRVRDALRRDDERRDRERIDAERAAVAAEGRAEDRRQRAVARLFVAMTEERHYLAKENGRPVVDPRLLARFGLTLGDVTGEAERSKIAALAERQTIEGSRIAIHVERSPEDIIRDGDGWLLADSAPADVRALVVAWRQDATMQRALARVVAARSTATPVRVPVESQPEQPGAGWRRARASREQVMAESDIAERLYDTGLIQPGNRIARPGSDRATGSVRLTRRFPGLPGTGIGG